VSHAASAAMSLSQEAAAAVAFIAEDSNHTHMYLHQVSLHQGDVWTVKLYGPAAYHAYPSTSPFNVHQRQLPLKIPTRLTTHR
jgi:hypothetical protein